MGVGAGDACASKKHLRYRSGNWVVSTCISVFFPEHIKLVGGKNEREGNIMVGGKPVCDDGFKKYGKAAAQVVCRFILIWHKTIIHIFLTIFSPRELGYDGGQYTKESHFGKVSDDFMMDEVQCKGNEEKLLDCPYWSKHDCNKSDGLGVICTPKIKKGEVEKAINI